MVQGRLCQVRVALKLWCLDEPGAPAPKLTGGQKKVLRGQGWQCDDDGGGSQAPVAAAEQRGRRRGRRVSVGVL